MVIIEILGFTKHHSSFRLEALEREIREILASSKKNEFGGAKVYFIQDILGPSHGMKPKLTIKISPVGRIPGWDSFRAKDIQTQVADVFFNEDHKEKIESIFFIVLSEKSIATNGYAERIIEKSSSI